MRWFVQSLREPLVLSHHLRQLPRGIRNLQRYPAADLTLDTIGAVYYQFSLLSSDLLYLVKIWSIISTKASRSCSSSARTSMSLAHWILVIFLLPMLTFHHVLPEHQIMIHSRKMLKRVGDRRHPRLTPTVVLNHSCLLSLIWTALVVQLLNGAN